MQGFYELIFVLSGELKLNICGSEVVLSQKEFTLIRPDDVCKRESNQSEYLSVLFPTAMFAELMGYLNCHELMRKFEAIPYVKQVHLTNTEFLNLKEQIQMLDRIEHAPMGEMSKYYTRKRILLFEVVLKLWDDILFMRNEEAANLPGWLTGALNQWNTSENRQKGLEFFCEQTGFTKEHLCRSFKKYLGISPSVYLNKQRLKHALLLMEESKYSMIEIAFEAGFKSSSRFYHVFKETYGVSPKQFFQGKL